MKKLCFTLVVAAVLWAVMFSPQTMPLINFWEMMAGSALTLAVLACLFDNSEFMEYKKGYGILKACYWA